MIADYYYELRELAEAARDAWENPNTGAGVYRAASDALIAYIDEELILSLLDALKAATERAERAERERYEALEDRKQARAECVQERTRADELAGRALRAESERDEARAERDARPEITPEDAAAALVASGQFSDPGNVMDEWAPILVALRAHARKAVKS